MQSSKDIIKNDKYRNWVKGTLGIEQTNRAVCEYVKEKFTLYLQGRATLNPNEKTQSYLTAAELSHLRDDMKALFRQRLNSLVKYKKISGREEWQWDSRTYNCAECKGTFQKILSLHKGQLKNLKAIPKKTDYKDINWQNSNDTRNLSLEWAIAKIFMPKGNEQNGGPDDTDPSAMFSLMAMCDLFTNPIKGTNLKHLIDTRNSLFHSSDNLVSDNDVDDFFGYMRNLLGDASSDPDVGSSIRDRLLEDIKKIEKLKESEMTMTLFEDAQKAIRIARKAIYYDFEERLCNNDPDQLRELLKLAVKLGSDLQFLNDHFDELKLQNKEIKELQKASNEKQNQIRNLQVLLTEQHIERKVMQEQIEEKNLKIREIEKKLDDQVAENSKLRKGSIDDKENIRSMENTIADHLEEINNLRQQFDDKVTEIKENFNKIKHLNTLCSGKEDEIEELHKENDALKVQNAEQEGNIADLLKQIGDQRNKNATLSAEIDDQSLEIKDLQKQNKNHRYEIEKLCEEKESMLGEISTLCKKRDDQQREIEETHEQIDSQQSKITKQLCEIQNLREQNEEIEVKINHMLKENQEQLQEIKKLRESVSSLDEQVEELQKQLDEKSSEVRVMLKQTADEFEEIKRLQHERDYLHSNILDLQKQNVDQCYIVQKLKENIDRKNAEIQILMAQGNYQHNEIEELRKQKDSIEWDTVAFASAIAVSLFVLLGR